MIPFSRRAHGPSFFALVTALLASCSGDGPIGPPVPAELRIVPDEVISVEPGEVVQLDARLLSTTGAVLSTTPIVQWSSSNASMGPVDASGRVTALASGTVTIRANTGEFEGSATVRITLESPFLPVTPQDALATVPFEQQLTLSGSAEAQTWSAPNGGLPPGLTLSASGLISGAATSPGIFSFDLRAEDGNGAITGRMAMRVCPGPLSLAIGELTVRDPDPIGGCGLLLRNDLGGRVYRIGSIRTTTTIDAGPVRDTEIEIETFDFPGFHAGVSPSLDRFPTLRAFDDTGAQARFGPEIEEALRIETETAEFHTSLREAEIREFGSMEEVRLASPDTPLSRLQVGAHAANAPARRVFTPFSGGCTGGGGTRVGHLLAQDDGMAVYRDSIQAGSAAVPVSAEDAEALIEYYSTFGKPIIDQYFGGVPDLNGDGQIVVFISPVATGNVAGFVWSGDLIRRGSCARSNEMELIYLNSSSVLGVRSNNFQVLGTVVHEAKHISSLYARIRAADRMGVSSSFHPSWIEEGTAEIAAEVSSRVAWESIDGPGVTDRIVTESFDLVGSTFPAESFGVALRLARMINYLSSQPNGIMTDPLNAPSSHDLRGGAWLLFRFLGDAYGNAASSRFGERAIFAAMNESTAPTGIEGIESVLGRPIRAILEEYLAAILLADRSLPQPNRAFTTYDLVESTDVFSSPNPPGRFPWSVTNPNGPNRIAPFLSGTVEGPTGPSGIRVHDFFTTGQSFGVDLRIRLAPPARVVITRIQ